MGCPSVRHLKQQITYREFAEWLAFYQVEPFGPAQEDYRAAAGMMPHVGSKFKPERVFPSLARAPQQMTPEGALVFFRGLARRGHGTFKEGSSDGDDS